MQKSKVPGPPLKDYVEIIEQNGPKVTETALSIGERGEQRSLLTFQTDKPSVNPYEGVMRAFRPGLRPLGKTTPSI